MQIVHLCAFRFRVQILLVHEFVQFSRMVRCAGAFAFFCNRENATFATLVRLCFSVFVFHLL